MAYYKNLPVYKKAMELTVYALTLKDYITIRRRKMRAVTGVFTALFFMFFINDAMAKSFVDNGNGTVVDDDTGFVWQAGEGGAMSWESALSYCKDLSGREWRLPARKVLRSLVDYSKFNPALDTAYFPEVASSYYWSATTDVGSTSYAWRVDFLSGHVYASNKSGNYYVRCVSGS